LVYFYAAVVSFFIAMTSFLRVAEFAYVAYAQMGLAYVYYLIGSLRIVEAWRRPARLCGLVAAGLLGLTGEVFADQQTAAALSLLAVVLFLIAHSREYRSNPGGPLANPVLALRLSSVALTLIGMYQADALGEPVLTAAYFAAYGLSFAGFAAYNKIPGFVYLANFAFAAAVVYIQQALAFTDAFLGFFLLALAFTAISYLPALRKSPQNWLPVFRRSGLALGAVIAVSAPAFSGPLIAVVLAAVATLFALEAWQARKVWLAVAADLLYIEAYFFVLFALNINEQQFFTTGAAALGLALHYLLRKMDAPRTTFVAGLLSQFVLLGSSYIQMVQTENLSFFLVLFFQGLAVIVYGTVIRSRSLVLVPIGFIVLGIASIVVKAFSDFLSLIAIGCSGLLLLGLGIWALFLRERIDKAGERVRATFADWSP
jgi:hypothetical protein